MKTISSNPQLRANAREQLSGNWGTAILAYLIFLVMGSLVNLVPFIGFIISILISGALTLGLIACFLNLVRDNPFRFENLFDGFANFKSSLLLYLLRTILIFLWSLLLIIPGIIAAYKYSMAFYILHDNPEIGASLALEESKQMMDGYKGKLFSLHLSFIGWAILSVLTLGIGFLWFWPYVMASTANFYQNLKEVQANKTRKIENDNLNMNL